MKNGRLQVKDIPDDLVVRAVRATPGYWRFWTAVKPNFDALMPGVPFKVFARKVESMTEVHSCCIDCRGDVHLAEECRGC